MQLHYTSDGYMIIMPWDDPRQVVDVMLQTNYEGDFCVSPFFDTDFIIRLMEAGFLIMSAEVTDENGEPGYILLPRLHLVRSVLFYENLHIKKSIKRYLNRYELRFNSHFNYIVNRCIEVHGNAWLTPPLIKSIKQIRKKETCNIRPVSFTLYRDKKPVAGEFGIISGKVYTSYSGYYDESNAGTVQLILTTRYLQENGYAFFDLGMPLDYKADLGAVNIKPEEFVALFRAAQNDEMSG